MVRERSGVQSSPAAPRFSVVCQIHADYQYNEQNQLTKKNSYTQEEILQSEITYGYVSDQEIELVVKRAENDGNLSIDSESTIYLNDIGQIKETVSKSYRSNGIIRYEYIYMDSYLRRNRYYNDIFDGSFLEEFDKTNLFLLNVFVMGCFLCCCYFDFLFCLY